MTKLNKIIILLLIIILGTSYNVFGCDWTSRINNPCTLHLIYRGMEERGIEVRTDASTAKYRNGWMTVTTDLRTRIASLESRKEFEDAETIKEIDVELLTLYLQTYQHGITMGYFIDYD